MSGSTLADALSDPGITALLGAAQGFGQAAMPTRMPTPWGAALGMGAGGALAGAQQGQRAQYLGAQTQGQQLQNVVAASGVPLAIQRNQALASFWAHPEQIQQMMGSGASQTAVPLAAPAPVAPDTTKLNAAALASLPDDKTRGMAANAIMAAGLPQEAIAPWISAVHNESAWNAAVLDHTNQNGTIDRGLGQINSATAPTIGYDFDRLKDPQTNLIASAKYFGQRFQASGGDPAMALGTYGPQPGGKPDPDYIGKGINRMYGWGYAGAPTTQVAAPGGGAVPGPAPAVPGLPAPVSGSGQAGLPATPQEGFTMATDYENRANILERQQATAKYFQGQGMPVMPPAGDPAALRTAAQQLRAYALAGPTAKTQAENQNVIIRPGGAARIQTPQGPQWTKLPDRIETVDTATGNKNWAYATPPLVIGNQAVEPGQLSPVTGAGGAPVVAEAPGITEAIKERARVMGNSGIAPGFSLGASQPLTAGVPAPGAATSPSATGPLYAPLATPSGAAAVSAAVPPAAVPPPAVQADVQHIAPGITTRSVPGGGVAYTNTREIQDAQYKTDLKDVNEVGDEANAVQQNMGRLYEARNLIGQLPQTGSGGQWRANIANLAQTYIKPLPGLGNAADEFLHAIADLPDAAIAQRFNKLMVQGAGIQENSVMGARGSIGLMQLFLRANPGLENLPDANKVMVNFLLTQNQMQLDYMRGLQNHFATAGADYRNGRADYRPVSDFDNQWTGLQNEKTYVSATSALSGHPFSEWSGLVGNDPAMIKATLGIVQRIDPTAQVMWEDGQPHVFTPQAGAPNAP